MQRRKTIPLVTAVAALLVSMGADKGWAYDFMPTAGQALQPIGHYEFCQREPDDCRRHPYRGPVAMTRELWSQMVEVNDAVNAAVFPVTDMELWGVEEHWSYPDMYGDCEDYVLEKRRRLIEAGVPPGNLLITVVLQPDGDGHAVLTVTTSSGDFILDNMEERILSWSESPYRFLKRQSAHGGADWVSIDDGRAVAVGTVPAGR